MYAITPLGIGKKVGARSIRPDWELTDNETFTVDEWNDTMVLAEDGKSLRQGTPEELAEPETKSETLKLAELLRDKNVITQQDIDNADIKI